MRIFFFSDICGTLYRTNTSYLFLYFYFSRNNRTKWFYVWLLLSLPAKVLWKSLGKIIAMDWLRNHLLGLLKGESQNTVEAEAKTFAVEVLSSFQNNLACEKARTGHPLVLVSATLSPLAKAIADNFGAEAYLATQMEVENGVFTGKIAFDVRSKKLELLRLSIYGNYLDQSTFMTDNQEDLSLVKKVKKAIIIAPSRKHKQFWLKQRVPGLSFLK